MIPVVLFLYVGYAVLYTGLAGISNGALTNGNTQGLLASLGWPGAAGSAATAFKPSESVTAAQPAASSANAARTLPPGSAYSKATPINGPEGPVASAPPPTSYGPGLGASGAGLGGTQTVGE